MDNPEARSPADPLWLFGGTGLLVLAAVTMAAAALSAVEVALLAGTLLVAGAATRAWASWSLRGIAYARTLSPHRAFRGDALQLETSLANRKLLPLPWVEVWERLPLALGPSGEAERSAEHPGWVWICQGAALWPYQRARWRHVLECRQRGVFALPEATIRSGDPFGAIEREALVAGRREVVVYPRVVPLRRLALPLRHASLDATGARSLVSDPTRTAALRDYQPGDPRRLIHWPTTARRGALHVRVLEPATSLNVSLVLDVRGFGCSWALSPEPLLELAISALASIAVHLDGRSCPVSVFVNAGPIEVRPGTGAAHLESILEALARLEVSPSRPLLPWLAGVLPRGSTVVLLTSDAAPHLAENVARLREAGFSIQTIVAAAGERASASPVDRAIRLTPGVDLAAALEGRT